MHTITNKITILILAMALHLSAVAQDSLYVRLDSIISSAQILKTSQMGLLVYDLTADSTIYTYNALQTCRPASTMKLLTAITALDELGADYKYHTELRYNGDDIYIRGSIDPLLSHDDLASFSSQLHVLGIDTIHGNIYADRSFISSPIYGEGWCWDDKNPILSPLTYNNADSLLESFVDILKEDSITFQGNISIAFTPKGSKFVCDITHTVSDLLIPMMKKSDNLCAESIYYQIGASDGLPSTSTKARKIEESLLHKIHLDTIPHRLADGSGLSLYNYLSPDIEVGLLKYAYKHKKRIFTPLYDVLPIAGVDGTLASRMKDTPAQNNVHAKTGSVTGISALAGYCTTSSGHLLAFSIMNQNILKSSQARALQDTICITLTK